MQCLHTAHHLSVVFYCALTVPRGLTNNALVWNPLSTSLQTIPVLEVSQLLQKELATVLVISAVLDATTLSKGTFFPG